MTQLLERHGGDMQRAMLSMPYGLYVIGSADRDGTLNGMIAAWVMQVAFEPRLVALSLENDARTLEYIRNTGHFSVNILSEPGGFEIARHVVMPSEGRKFAGRSHEVVYHKLDGLEFETHASGVPVLSGGLGWYACRTSDLVPVGDHTLVLGEVIDAAVFGNGEALLERDLGWEYAG
jgi:flavin reductase (DIM6/NTAB) family NADH-FMN oxidoreductase RutF